MLSENLEQSLHRAMTFAADRGAELVTLEHLLFALVEDEDAIRRVLKKVLSEENPKYKLDEASDGEKAISLIKTQHYDLVLCDIKMPKKDGIEVLEFVS